MSRTEVRYLYNIPVWEMMVVVRGKRAELIRRVMPPRTMCWKPTLGTFFNTWKNRINNWKHIKPELDRIEELELNRKRIIQDQIRKVEVEKEPEPEVIIEPSEPDPDAQADADEQPKKEDDDEWRNLI